MKKTKPKNNLLLVNPSLAKEWHPTKNGKLTPKDVTPGSDRKVWWQCKKGHEWLLKWPGFGDNSRELSDIIPDAEERFQFLVFVNRLSAKDRTHFEGRFSLTVEPAKKIDLMKNLVEKKEIRSETGLAYIGFIESRLAMIAALTKDIKETINLRIPLEYISGGDIYVVGNFLRALGDISNISIELYYMTGMEGETAPGNIYQKYGINVPVAMDKNRENTISILSLFGGGEQEAEKTGTKKDVGTFLRSILGMDPNNTQVVPVGSVREDPYGLIRGVIMGLDLLYIARQAKAVRSGMIGRVDEAFVREVMKSWGRLWADHTMAFPLDARDIIEFASSDMISKRIDVLKKLIDSIPMAAYDYDEMREIFYHISKKFA
ncbi:MAG: zinc-ribbon domain-containing protein [Candidatus Omnitrophica bacterium]|nr:zinc-ribbon domain-containing protein [Candidatus Omnitrophota bacterium]